MSDGKALWWLVTFGVVEILAACLMAGSRGGQKGEVVAKVDLIDGSNSVAWARGDALRLGGVPCRDGKLRVVQVGLREDGMVVWRVGGESAVVASNTIQEAVKPGNSLNQEAP